MEKKLLLQKPRQQQVKVHFINVEMTDKTHFVLLVLCFQASAKFQIGKEQIVSTAQFHAMRFYFWVHGMGIDRSYKSWCRLDGSLLDCSLDSTRHKIHEDDVYRKMVGNSKGLADMGHFSPLYP